jgi:hypothetical protein
MPLSGTWKTLVRIHQDDALMGLPLYLPEDEAIPAPAVSSPEGTFRREFVDETQILQRELKDDVPGYLAAVAYTLVGSIVLAIIVLLGWILVRLGRAGSGPQPRPQERTAPPKQPATPRGASGAPA